MVLYSVILKARASKNIVSPAAAILKYKILIWIFLLNIFRQTSINFSNNHPTFTPSLMVIVEIMYIIIGLLIRINRNISSNQYCQTLDWYLFFNASLLLSNILHLFRVANIIYHHHFIPQSLHNRKGHKLDLHFICISNLYQYPISLT